MILVFDATPLIYLAKIEKLHLLEKVDAERIIPASVFEEVVVKGKKLGKPDAAVIEKLIEQGVFKVEDVEKTGLYEKLKENKNLSKADIDTLTLAHLKSGMAIVDEDYVRRVAEVEGIECRGTIYLVFSLLKGGVISKFEARKIVDDMVENGWYCSTNLYAKILKRIEKL
jgi:predicted nucleic acid-binding protein